MDSVGHVSFRFVLFCFVCLFVCLFSIYTVSFKTINIFFFKIATFDFLRYSNHPPALPSLTAYHTLPERGIPQYPNTQLIEKSRPGETGLNNKNQHPNGAKTIMY